ncbi:two-component system response regulator QseB [Pseudonocardia sediminis]|uniref:Two-component system response regulator QseB n=1 Tax=Pseudonocardia sediminis TaxID=1397368 RepID=A0A4Q7UTT9_PSEST|nr:response regulator transcription factor [Pseudonocardia sediminis]RZT83423.1 two-component system response regulator QseB [Pseudonocardia sediminis]
MTDVLIPSQRTHARPHTVLLALPPSATSLSVQRGLRHELGADGVAVVPVSDGIGLLDGIRSAAAALVVLDMELPGPDPGVVLGALHNEAPTTPVVAITSRERRGSLVGLLRGDRDDFLLRPFMVDELTARIRLRLRAAAGLPAPMVLSHGGLAVEIDHEVVSVDGRPIALSPTEYALLLALLARPGEVVSHDDLADQAWSEPVSANLVQVYISYLRRKIGPERIRTVRGAGYQLEG